MLSLIYVHGEMYRCTEVDTEIPGRQRAYP